MKKPLFLILGLCCLLFVTAQKPGGGYKLIDKLTTKPEFPGGPPAMYAFLYKNIVYPQIESDYDIQGKVLLRFMVDTTGLIQDIKILRAVSPGLDKEAIRIVKLMPKWKPATYRNKPVPVYYTLPIKFSIS